MKENGADSEWIRKMKAYNPRLKDLDGFTSEVLNRIEPHNRRGRFAISGAVLLKIAAMFLLVFGLTNYAWQEVDTWQQRDRMLVKVSHTRYTSISESSCRRQIGLLLRSVNSSPTWIHPDKIVLKKSEILKMIPIKSHYMADIQMFMDVLEKYYPRDYESYCVKGQIVLSARSLKQDERLCEIFEKTKKQKQ